MDNKDDVILPSYGFPLFEPIVQKSDVRIVLERVNSLVHIVEEMLGLIKHLHYGEDDVSRVQNGIDLLKDDIQKLLKQP